MAVRRLILLICCAVLFAQGTSAIGVEAVVRAFDSRYQHARTLKAIFFESYKDGHGGVSADSGTVYFSRPGRMRWDYESPEQKLFLVDGVNVWFYVPADHTVSRAKLSQSSDWRTPIALLAGKTDLSKLCRQIEPVDSASGKRQEPGKPSAGATNTAGAAATGSVREADGPVATTLRCLPRESSASESIQDVLLDIDPDGFLTRIVVRQPGDASTEFRFGNWQENLAIPEAQFHFEPPPGVAIVDEQSLADTLR